MNDHRLSIGVIADDFTGAGDAASYLRSGGFNTKLVIYPHMEDVDTTDCDAVVIALKSRSEEHTAAVRESLTAAGWLKSQGAQKLYFKYCSTFDSTPHGNIGPVADALLESLDCPYTLLCPSLPENGRTVRDGVLYVNGVPLGESHMRHHPLNPMWDSRIPALMAPQSKYPTYILHREEMDDPAVLQEKLAALQKSGERFYLVPDYCTPDDGKRIAALFDALPLWTGGSELLMHFAAGQTQATGQTHRTVYAAAKSKSTHGRLMLCGSCSDMTQRQVKRWLASGGKGRMILPGDGARSDEALLKIAAEYLENPQTDFLFYSSGSVGMRDDSHTDSGASADIETSLSRLAALITKKAAVDRVIVAGGETSGAVTQALKLHCFAVGDSVAPGVPVLYPQGSDMRLVLKSGNFGNEEFFLHTLED